MQVSMKLSTLRDAMIKNKFEFLCHAVVDIARDSDRNVIWSQGYRVMPDSLYHELLRIAPKFFKKFKDTDEIIPDNLTYWGKNLPGHLRDLNSRDRHSYRVRFLNWMISKFGDQTINVEVYKAFTVREFR